MAGNPLSGFFSGINLFGLFDSVINIIVIVGVVLLGAGLMFAMFRLRAKKKLGDRKSVV